MEENGLKNTFALYIKIAKEENNTELFNAVTNNPKLEKHARKILYLYSSGDISVKYMIIMALSFITTSL